MLSDEQRDRLEAWVVAVAPRAAAYARSLVADPNQAEDVVQECLYQLLRHAGRYNLEQDGVKLLFKAISNRCINRATRHRAILSLDGAGSTGRPIPVVDAAGLRPDEVAEHRELEDRVGAALQTLPEVQRAAVELRSLGMSKEEIGEVLGVSPSNAGVLVHRGRLALAAALGIDFAERKS
jgi:RNA polymerase sigma-70 factor (ECF subfamily)